MGLLNAIEGLASHEGHILLMITNHPKRLDPVLIDEMTLMEANDPAA
jgi:hypothetical protein